MKRRAEIKNTNGVRSGLLNFTIKDGVWQMYQKLSGAFMVFWVMGLIAMSVFQQLWLLKILIPLFIVFWVWGLIRMIRHQTSKRKESRADNSTSGREKGQIGEERVKKERGSIFGGFFDSKDDRFKR